MADELGELKDILESIRKSLLRTAEALTFVCASIEGLHAQQARKQGLVEEVKPDAQV